MTITIGVDLNAKDELIQVQMIGKSFSDLSQEDQYYLATRLRPAGVFSEWQKDQLNKWVLVLSKSNESELKKLNLVKSHTRAEPMQVASGLITLPISLLTDCRPGETYDHLREFLMKLKFYRLTNLDIPKSEI